MPIHVLDSLLLKVPPREEGAQLGAGQPLGNTTQVACPAVDIRTRTICCWLPTRRANVDHLPVTSSLGAKECQTASFDNRRQVPFLPGYGADAYQNCEGGQEKGAGAANGAEDIRRVVSAVSRDIPFGCFLQDGIFLELLPMRGTSQEVVPLSTV